MAEYRTRGTHPLARGVMVVVVALLCAGAPLWATGADEGASAEGMQPAELTFTFWGSPFEREAVDLMVAAFNEANPNIEVRGQHIPDGYHEKIATMVAGGTPPRPGLPQRAAGVSVGH